MGSWEWRFTKSNGNETEELSVIGSGVSQSTQVFKLISCGQLGVEILKVHMGMIYRPGQSLFQLWSDFVLALGMICRPGQSLLNLWSEFILALGMINRPGQSFFHLWSEFISPLVRVFK